MQRETLGPLEVQHAREQLALRQRQLFELSSTMEALAPGDVLRKAQAEEALREAQELAKFQVCVCVSDAVRELQIALLVCVFYCFITS